MNEKDKRVFDETEEEKDVIDPEEDFDLATLCSGDQKQPEEVEETEDTEEVVESAPEQDEEVELPPNKLYQFYWDCGRMGNLEGLFVATDEEIQKIVGKKIYFGEALGKHSNIEGILKEEHLAVKSDDQNFIARLIKVFDRMTISGYNPLDYYRED